MSKRKPEWAYKVKNFGDDSECRDLDELKLVLRERYLGKSISIVFPTQPNGILKTIFADVSSNEDISASYGKKETINLDDLKG